MNEKRIVGLLLIFPMLFLSCSGRNSNDLVTLMPDGATKLLIISYVETGRMMCREEISEAQVDSIFNSLMTENVKDSIYQVNLYFASKDYVFSKSMHPDRAENDVFEEGRRYLEIDSNFECLKDYAEGHIIFLNDGLFKKRRFIRDRRESVNDTHEFALEFYVEQP